MNYESRHETLASIPNEEARGWKHIALASLSIYPHLSKWDDPSFSIEAFLIPEWAQGVCQDAADSVTKHMQDGGFDAATIDAYHRDGGKRGGHHAVTRVGDTIIDFTRRQFDADADVPTIEGIDDFTKKFRIGKEAAQRIKPEDAQALEQEMGEMAQEQGWQDESTPYQDRSAIVHTFDNGWTIREPMYNGDAFREGELMSNCLSGDDEGLLEQIERNNRTWSHEQDLETWQTPYMRHPNPEFRYLSLRDPNNIPHITFNLDNSKTVASVFGRHNAPPKDSYRKMVMNFLHEKLGDFEEYENFTGDEPGDLVAMHTQDRSCCEQSKVAAFKLKPEHAEAVEREMNEIAKEEGWQDDDYRPYPDTSSILYRLDNGWTVRALKSIGDVFREGSLMGHCLAERAFDARMERLTGFDDSHRLTDNHPDVESPDSWTKGGRSYLSLRDENNLPHLTFNIEDHKATAENPDGRGEGYVAEFVGRHNSTPQDKYETMVSEFLHWYFKGKAYGEESWILDPETRGGDDEWIDHPASDKPYSDQPWVDPYVEAQTKVAADPQKEEQVDGQNMEEPQEEISAEQQQQMQALQKSNVFNHIVHVHKVDPEQAAELFFQSPVLLSQEHEREHQEGLVTNHLPETLIVAKKVAAETKLQLLEKAKKLPNDTSEIVQLFDDGWSIRRPITVGDHFRESKLMSNCVYNAIYEPMAAYPKRWLNQCPQCEETWKKCACEADDVYSYLLETLTDGYFDDRVTDYALKYPKQKANSGELVYYSLRDPNNIPHVSIGGVNGDSFGRHNSEVKDEYQKYLNAFDDEYPKTLVVAEKKALVCSCGSTQFRRVIDPLRTYAKGGHDAYDYECRNCLKLASASDSQGLLRKIQDVGGIGTFDDQVADWLGPRAFPVEEVHPDHPFFNELDSLHHEAPPYIFRVMSEEHFQNSLRDGFHQTDGRENFRSQEKRDIENGLGGWGLDDSEMNQGTVASIWPMIGYISHSPNGHGRVVKIQVHPDDEWTLDSSNDENRDWHTLKPIPVSRFVGWTPTINNYAFLNEDGKRHIYTRPDEASEVLG